MKETLHCPDILGKASYRYMLYKHRNDKLKLRSHRAPGPPRTVPDPIRG